MGKGTDEKTLVSYDELDEASEAGDDFGRPQKTAVDHCCMRTEYAITSVCPCCNFSTRFTIAILSSIGFVISFGIRCNMGVAVLQMTEQIPTENSTTDGNVTNITRSFSVSRKNSKCI